MLPARADAFLGVDGTFDAKSEAGSTVPKNIDLCWFMPALVKRRVGSERGTTEDEGTEFVN